MSGSGVEAPFMRSPYNYDLEKASDESACRTVGESLTVQSMAEDADINVLMHRFGITGKMPENPRVPSYGDFTGISDFQSALDAIENAREGFMELPAQMRARFENNPQKLLEFVANAANVDEAEKLGLLHEDVVKRRQAERQAIADAAHAKAVEAAKAALASSAKLGAPLAT